MGNEFTERLEMAQDEHSEMLEVLAWASENVWSIDVAAFKSSDPKFREWFLTLDNGTKSKPQPTIYDALYEAWVNRDK